MSAAETTARVLIARWPNDRDFADDLGERPQQAAVWRHRGLIPADKWPCLVEAARRRGIDVTLAELGAMMLNAVRRRNAAKCAGASHPASVDRDGA